MSIPVVPAFGSLSVSSAHDLDSDDSIFSNKSVQTSATSLSLSPNTKSKPPASNASVTRRASYSGLPSSRHRSSALPDWSKDVRWLVPPSDSVTNSSNPYLQGIKLIEIEHEPSSRNIRTSIRRRTTIGRSLLFPRMSAVWEEEEGEDFPETRNQESHQKMTRPVSALGYTTPRRPRGQDHMTRRSLSLTPSSTTSSSLTVPFPTTLSVSAGSMDASTGFTSLTLPRAGYVPSKRPGRVNSSVDLTRSGIAQTTMSTISIARRKPRKKTDNTPDRLREDVFTHLSFTSHLPPPSKVHSRQVLVKVWTVGLDGLDALLLADRAERSDGYGYIPGRSFVGRVLESGWDVNGISKGDWVYGLLEVKKAGALAEFILVDQRHVHRAPHQSPTLRQEHLALLALSGVAAHRAVRTLTHLPADSRALVLNAHAGPGLLVTQLLAARGIAVTAHVPGGCGSGCERRARLAGAAEVRCGEIRDVVARLEEGKFDAVVDTVGGKDVWDMCQKALSVLGQFTTLNGDTPHLPVAPPRAHFKSNMRSLRRAFFKQAGYQWVSPSADVDASGEDIKDSLAAVATLAEEEVLRPYVWHGIMPPSPPDRGGDVGTPPVEDAMKVDNQVNVDLEGCVFPFERASEAMRFVGGESRTLGRTAVVRIVES